MSASHSHIRRSAVVTASTSIGTSFDKSKAAVAEIGHVRFWSDCYIRIKVDNIVSAGSLSLRVTTDADGDEILLPDTAASIAVGLTDTDSGVAGFYAEVPFFRVLSEDQTWYLHAKTDAGTLDIVSLDIVAKSFR